MMISRQNRKQKSVSPYMKMGNKYAPVSSGQHTNFSKGR